MDDVLHEPAAGVRCAVLQRAVPAGVVVAEAYDDAAGTDLLPEEAAVVRHAVAQRRREFATVRYCARRALAGLEGPTPRRAPLVPGERGAPRWPDGIVGSMTHCDGYRAAAVARSTQWASLGIDAEPNEPLPDGVLEIVASDEEAAALHSAPPGACWDRLLFSAKESVYKAWFPATGGWLGFDEVSVAFDHGGTFTATLLRPGLVIGGRPVRALDGRWLVANGFALTAVAVRAAAPFPCKAAPPAPTDGPPVP